MKHLKNKRAASTHLNFTDIEAKTEECFEKGALSIRLATNGNNFRDGESLAESDSSGLETVVSFKARFGIGVLS